MSRIKKNSVSILGKEFNESFTIIKVILPSLQGSLQQIFLLVFF